MRCSECTHYRKAGRSKCSRQSTPHTEQSSHVNYRYLTKDELKERLHELHTQERNTAKKCLRPSEKIAASVGTNVDDDVKQIMEQCSDDILSKQPPNLFPHIFWKQQLQSASLSNNRQRRWHPLMIKWALYIPRDYTYFIESTVGFLDAEDKQLMEVAKLSEFQKCVDVVLDEMHIKEDLVFSKNSGDFIGFTNLGQTNDLLLQYERTLEYDTFFNSFV